MVDLSKILKNAVINLYKDGTYTVDYAIIEASKLADKNKINANDYEELITYLAQEQEKAMQENTVEDTVENTVENTEDTADEDVELIEKVAHLEERAKSNTKRLDEHNTEIENLKNTYKIMEKMDYRMSNVENNVSEIKEDIQKGKEQKRYEVG